MLENILDNLPIAAKVKDVDNDMRYTFINKKAEELFEYPAKEAIGRTDFDIMPEAATTVSYTHLKTIGYKVLGLIFITDEI